MIFESSGAGGQITFEGRDVERFAEFSGDRNPLHMDPSYARRTPFGGCVVHGLLGVMAVLREVMREGPIWVRTLRCACLGPLFVDVTYDLRSERSGPCQAAITIARGKSRKLEVHVEYEPAEIHAGGPVQAEWAMLTESTVQSPASLAGASVSGVYGATGAALAALADSLGVSSEHLGFSQWQSLGWVSYFCGMVMPGRQSLIWKVDLSFLEQRPESIEQMTYQAAVRSYDQRFSLLSVSASLQLGGARFAEAAINAFVRPPSVAYALEPIAEMVGHSNRFDGQVALVTGASRGLGAVIATALALHGCTVVINYRVGFEEAQAVHAALARAGARTALAAGDVTSPDDCRRLGEWVRQQFGRLDILVNNASPPIVPLAASELDAKGLQEFVGRNLSAWLLPTMELLPLLAESRGSVVTISSTYVQSSPAGFAHYVAAKHAVEGLTRALAREAPQVHFLIARPPRVHTDQTNAGFDLEPRVSPAVVARVIVEALSQGPAAAREVRVVAI